MRYPSEFLTYLLPQGAWARCSSCASRRRGLLRAQQGAQLGAQLGGDNATAALLREIARAATQRCAQCRETKPKSAFWKEDWRHRGQGIKCTDCEPRAPGQRPRSLFSELTCKQCGVAKPRDQFCPRDLHNQRRGISCKACLPTPPEERPRGRPLASASSGRTV